MKRKTLGVWVLVALGTLIMGLGNAQQLLTPDQAKDAVRTFENDFGMVFTDCGLREWATGPTWNQTKWYYVTQPSGGDYDRIWRVQAYTGEILQAYYGDRLQNDSEQPVGPRTQQECLIIGENYARSKYTGFDAMGFAVSTQEWRRTGWRFTWTHTVQYGARTFNMVEVDVNPIDGLVQRYWASRYAVVTPSQPQFTTQQAIDRAMQEASLVTQLYLEGPILFADPDGGITYSVIVGGVDTLGENQHWNVCLNAIDGSLVSKQMASGYLHQEAYDKYIQRLEARKKALSVAKKGIQPVKKLAAKSSTATAGPVAVSTKDKAKAK